MKHTMTKKKLGNAKTTPKTPMRKVAGLGSQGHPAVAKNKSSKKKGGY